MSLVPQFWDQIGIKDFVDILIVAIILYQFMMIVRGTRAVQMLLGVGLLSLLFWAGASYQLSSLNWILAHFFESFFIILVVLFQDQIRSALASLPGQRPFWRMRKDILEREIDEVVEACSVLSKEKIGALIAIERTNGLSNYADTGTKVDANIHSDLVYALFQSRGPLHDGAVIISGNRIRAVGCFLPLSRNTDINRHWGTRHRAAMGLTEASDAVVIIVSEESGAIKLSLSGNIYECPNILELRAHLKALWANNGRPTFLDDEVIDGSEQ